MGCLYPATIGCMIKQCWSGSKRINVFRETITTIRHTADWVYGFFLWMPNLDICRSEKKSRFIRPEHTSNPEKDELQQMTSSSYSFLAKSRNLTHWWKNSLSVVVVHLSQGSMCVLWCVSAHRGWKEWLIIRVCVPATAKDVAVMFLTSSSKIFIHCATVTWLINCIVHIMNPGSWTCLTFV